MPRAEERRPPALVAQRDWSCGGIASRCPICERAPAESIAEAGERADGAHRASGRNPVCLAIRASIRGPISSESWNANATCGRALAHAAWKVTLKRSGSCSPCSRRSARTRKASASPFANASLAARTVAECSSEAWDLRDPAAILLALEFDGVLHVGASSGGWDSSTTAALDPAAGRCGRGRRRSPVGRHARRPASRRRPRSSRRQRPRRPDRLEHPVTGDGGDAPSSREGSRSARATASRRPADPGLRSRADPHHQ